MILQPRFEDHLRAIPAKRQAMLNVAELCKW